MGAGILQKYIVKLSIQAKKDFKNAVAYIKNELKEPIISAKYLELIKEKLNTLEHFSERFGVIDVELIKNKSYRKLLIKNYIVIYRIDSSSNTVYVVRLFHSRMDWQNML